MYHITSLNTILANFSTAPFLSKLCDPLPDPCGMAAPRGQRTDGWASPPHFHKHAEQYAYSSATRFRAPRRKVEVECPKKRRRRTACRPSLQDQRICVQFCRGAPCCNKTVPYLAAMATRSKTRTNNRRERRCRRHRLVLLCQSRSRHGRGRRVHRQEGRHVPSNAGFCQ